MFKLIMALNLGILFLLSSFSLTEAKMLIYPAKGQTAQQQAKDEYECHLWAVKQTGYDPTKSQEVPQYESSKSGGAVKGAIGGALLGAGIGAIAGDTGKGAAIGAGAGAVGGGLRQRRQNRQANERNQQTQQQVQQLLEEYNRAKAVCLEGRGYKVDIR